MSENAIDGTMPDIETVADERVDSRGLSPKLFFISEACIKYTMVLDVTIQKCLIYITVLTYSNYAD